MLTQRPAFHAEGNSAAAQALIRQYITQDGLRHGDKLPTERELAERFGVGRRAIRRALEALEAEGVIWRRQGSGTFVGTSPLENGKANTLASTDFAEIMEVRLRIEPQLAALAAMRARPEQIHRMHELADRISQSSDADERELWDGTLHRLIAQAARNTLFLTLFDVVNRVRQDDAWQALRERSRAGTASGVTLQQHHEIVDAIAARDPQAAAERMRQHLMMLQECLLRLTLADPLETKPDAPAASLIQLGAQS